jgi:hypothetical protein
MSSGYNFPDKKPSAMPPIEKTNVYSNPPAAAAFDKGTSTREGAAQAADAVREHSRDLGSRRSTPSSK